jgi:hypothetical protein
MRQANLRLTLLTTCGQWIQRARALLFLTTFILAVKRSLLAVNLLNKGSLMLVVAMKVGPAFLVSSSLKPGQRTYRRTYHRTYRFDILRSA